MTNTPEPEFRSLDHISSNAQDTSKLAALSARIAELEAENKSLRLLECYFGPTKAAAEVRRLSAENKSLRILVSGGVGESIKPPVQADTVIQVSVPTGWKLVPVEPTDDMFIEGMEADCRGRPSIDDDNHVRSIWRAMLSSAPDAPQPPAATDEPQLNGDAQLAHQQCRAVAHLARAVANAYDVRASMVANDAQLANLIGETSAAAMERLGDELNSMDSASETDDWLNPIFDAAQQRWLGNETEAPRPPAQSCCTCTKTADLHKAPAPAQQPVATVAKVHMSRYTIEWANGPLPEGTQLYAAPQHTAQQNPVAWKWRYKNGELSVASFDTRAQCERNSDDTAGEAVPLYTQPQQPVQQAPVGAQARFNDGETVTDWKSCSIERHNLVQSNQRFFSKYETRLIYTAPQPARPLLTEDQISEIYANNKINPMRFARAIEAAVNGSQQ